MKEIKNYECEYCNKSFTSKEDAEQHEKSHTASMKLIETFSNAKKGDKLIIEKNDYFFNAPLEEEVVYVIFEVNNPNNSEACKNFLKSILKSLFDIELSTITLKKYYELPEQEDISKNYKPGDELKESDVVQIEYVPWIIQRLNSTLSSKQIEYLHTPVKLIDKT